MTSNPVSVDPAAYWYTTNGMIHKRLSSRHTALLDQAFDRRTRVQIYDIDAFGPTAVAAANPGAGTMTAGNLHYGLYRHPSLVLNNSSAAIDSLILMDTEMLQDSTHESFRDGSTLDIFSSAEYQRFAGHSGRRRSTTHLERQCVCYCAIM